VPAPRRVAVVGSGVSGLTAAYVLEQAGSAVTLFEKDARLGGHADTHEVVDSAGRVQAVDTGFIVHNNRTYPVLLRLFAELGVETQESDMSMSVRCDGCGLEYAGAKGATGLFASRVRPRYVKMLVEVLRFHRRAHAVLRGSRDLTLDEFLDEGRFSPYFRNHFMTPVVSAVWSCPPSTAGRYPARYLFTFLDHHGLLAVTGSPKWRTVVGGSRSYVERAAKRLSAVQLSSGVVRVERVDGGVVLTDEDGETHGFDAVVIATHPHQALSMLAAPTAAETEVLGAIRYTANPTVLHTDTSVLPASTRAQASWNYLMDACESSAESVVVSYDMNRLQKLDAPERFVVTLNAAERIDQSTVVARMDYEHPGYTPESVAAQKRLPSLQDEVIAYAGAYHGWGFHEDGARSGVAAAESLGARW
jgi:predicted NAD/FAD-binding protein